MNKPPDKKQDEVPPMPFDEALRKLLKAPPQHRTTKGKKKTGD
jgi:hypothetical protein